MRLLVLSDIRRGADDDDARRAALAAACGRDDVAAIVSVGNLLADDLVDQAIVEDTRALLATATVPVFLVPGGADPAADDGALAGVTGPATLLADRGVAGGTPLVALPVLASDPWAPLVAVEAPEGAIALGWGGPVGPDGTGPDRVVDTERLLRQGLAAIVLGGRARDPEEQDGVLALGPGPGPRVEVVVIDASGARLADTPADDPVQDAPSDAAGGEETTEVDWPDGVLAQAAAALADDPEALAALADALRAEVP